MYKAISSLQPTLLDSIIASRYARFSAGYSVANGDGAKPLETQTQAHPFIKSVYEGTGVDVVLLVVVWQKM